MGQNERWNRHIQELYILSGDIGTQDGFFTRVVPYATSVDTGGEFTPGYFHRRRLVSLYRNQLYFSELSKPVCRGSSRSFLNSPPVSALELLWSGDFISAEEAERIGLLSKVFDDDKLMDETYAFAERLTDGPSIAIRLTKQAVYQC